MDRDVKAAKFLDLIYEHPEVDVSGLLGSKARKVITGVEYIVKDNEGHGFHNEENRFEFYRRMEGFLARHLGSRTESPPPA